MSAILSRLSGSLCSLVMERVGSSLSQTLLQESPPLRTVVLIGLFAKADFAANGARPDIDDYWIDIVSSLLNASNKAKAGSDPSSFANLGGAFLCLPRSPRCQTNLFVSFTLALLLKCILPYLVRRGEPEGNCKTLLNKVCCFLGIGRRLVLS